MDIPNQHLQNTTEPAGQELLTTVAELTGLPQPLVHRELDEILKLSGTDSAALTLDDLRKAMIHYLETLGADLAIEEDSPAVDSE